MQLNECRFFRFTLGAAWVSALVLMGSQMTDFAAAQPLGLELYPAEQASIAMCPGELGSLEIGIRNPGPNPTTLRRIVHNAGCNCLQVRSISPATLERGQTAKVKLDIDTSGKLNDFEVTFRAVTDANETLEVRHRLKITILSDVAISPSLLEVGGVLPQASLANRLSVILDRSIDVSSVELETLHKSDAFKWSILGDGQDVPGSQGQVYTLDFTSTAPRWPGKFEEPFYLSLANDAGRIRKFKILVSGNVLPEISPQPGRLFLGYVKPGAVITKTVELLAKTQEPFEVIGVESESIRVVDHAVERISPTSKKIHISLQVGQESRLKIMKTPIRILLKIESGTTEMALPCIYTLARKP